MNDFKVRALEIHSQYAWNFYWVQKAIKFIKEHDMNSLVLHRNDFVDLIVYPGKYFGCKREKYKNIYERYQDIFRVLYKYTPTRRSGPYQRRAYLKRVIEIAQREGIDVYIENKELFFPDIILEFYPHLIKDGKICANEPFWWEFIKTKYIEFFEEFPEISGIITAPATGESKVSVSSNRCTCELCKNTSPHKWFKNLILSMYEPIKAAGKKLVIRDFVFNAKTHKEIVGVIEKLPEDIIIALKNTPHDYYPTFPNNPRIGNVGNHEQWIEFDSMGQYFGWGIGPSIMIDDMRKRMSFAKEKNATGIIIRTDWESLDGHSSFDTLNYINLIAGAALSKNLKTDSNSIYQRWLEEKGFYISEISDSLKRETTFWIENIMKQTWEVIKRTLYVNDCVFSDSSLLPVSLEHALWLAEEKNSLKDWDPSKANALSVEEENVRKIIEEKDKALDIIKKLFQEVKKGCKGITEEAHNYLIKRFDIFKKYVKMFRVATHAIILTKYLLNHTKSEFYEVAKDMMNTKLNDLISLADELKEFYKKTSFEHTVYIILDPERLLALHDDLKNRLSSNNIM